MKSTTISLGLGIPQRVQLGSLLIQNNILLSDLQSELASIYNVITYTEAEGYFIANFTKAEFESELINAYN